MRTRLSNDSCTIQQRRYTPTKQESATVHSYPSDDTPPHLQVNGTPDSFNRYELGLIEDLHHDDDSKMHMLWGTRFGNDRPKTLIDGEMDYDGQDPGGLAWNNGAPGSERVSLIEDDFGVMIARDTYSSWDFQGMQSVTMHEVGHALGAGWADDTPIPFVGFACGKCFEVYSGDVDGDEFEPDETPEEVNGVVRWSIMRNGPAENYSSGSVPRLAYSIEEASTIDFDDIPSREE